MQGKLLQPSLIFESELLATNPNGAPTCTTLYVYNWNIRLGRWNSHGINALAYFVGEKGICRSDRGWHFFNDQLFSANLFSSKLLFFFSVSSIKVGGDHLSRNFNLSISKD